MINPLLDTPVVDVVGIVPPTPANTIWTAGVEVKLIRAAARTTINIRMAPAIKWNAVAVQIWPFPMCLGNAAWSLEQSFESFGRGWVTATVMRKGI